MKRKNRRPDDAVLIFALPVLLAAVLGTAPSGALIYAQKCASCHGAQHEGTPDGPSLRHLGLADVDFNLSTGRMPAEKPWVEIEHRDERAGQQLPLDQIRAVEAYLAPVVAGGPPIPQVISGPDRRRGAQLYASNCQQCHAAGGNGGGIGRADWAPALHIATIIEVADAIRAGPAEMPRFSEQQLTQGDLNDLAGYVMAMQVAPPGANGIPWRSTGPVPEGALGYVAIIVLITFIFGFWRSESGGRTK
jgi:ubiquinol-cytochrome c reductase cytochrome c subunit